jgi:glycosyltransferase involved in cell wall biosynthesis
MRSAFMPWPTHIPHPTVSIVMPVQRHRGKLLEALAAWSSQDYPREKLEFVIASTGQEPQLDLQVEAYFRQAHAPRGGLAYIKTDNEIAQYAYAARYARGEWLMFTEPHCLPQSDCLRELIGNLIERDLVGGCGRTLSDHNTNRYARIEERVYLDDFPVWSQSNDWRKFTKRCFALRRDVYRAIGGFEDDYGWFSELVISARLDADGHRIGYVPTAAVQHFNATNMQEMFDYVWEYRREMARYLDVGSDTLGPYFTEMSTKHETLPCFVERAQRQAIRSALGHGLRRGNTSSGRRLVAAMFAALSSGGIPPHAQLACSYWLARFRFDFLSWTQDQAYRNYCEAATRLGKWAESTYRPVNDLHKVASKASVAVHGDVLPGELRSGLYGFHAPERYAGRKFRWTSPIASMVLQTPSCDGEITLDLGEFQSRGEELQAYWNGRPMGRRTAEATFAIQRMDFAENSPQVLTLICPPLANGDPRETRKLGLPLFGVHLSTTQRAILRRAS